MSERVCESCRRWAEGWCWLGLMRMPAEGTCAWWLERPDSDPCLRLDT